MVSNNHVGQPERVQEDAVRRLNDITPISVVGATPFVLVVNPAKVPAKNAKELQALLKAKPGGYNYASSGNGTIIHLAGAMFVDAAGVEVQAHPVQGRRADGRRPDRRPGRDGVVAVPAVQGQLKSGALRAIGVMGKRACASLPDVPTIAEQGFPEVDIAGWFAVVGPAKLPPAEVKRLHDAVVAAFATPEAKEAMAKQENVITPTTPEAAAQFFRSEQERYAKPGQEGQHHGGMMRPSIRTETFMADLFDNPMGLMGFEFVEFASPAPGRARAGVREARLHPGGASTARRTCALPPGRHQLHRQPRAEEPGRLLRAPSTARRPAAWRSG